MNEEEKAERSKIFTDSDETVVSEPGMFVASQRLPGP